MTKPIKTKLYVMSLQQTASDPDSYYGFGMTDEGEKVYIPVSVVAIADLEEGDEVTGYLSPNKNLGKRASDTPWFCNMAQR